MGTIADKLSNVIASKTDISAAILEKGGEVPTRLIDYGDAIRALPSGGDASALSNCLDDYDKTFLAFWDIDGNFVTACSKEEVSSWTSEDDMPEVPNLDSEGYLSGVWNWTWTDVQMALSNDTPGHVGPQYLRDYAGVGTYSSAVHFKTVTLIKYTPTSSADLDITVPVKYCNTLMTMSWTGSMSVDWGDGTPIQSLSAASEGIATSENGSTTGYVNTPTIWPHHTYTNLGQTYSIQFVTNTQQGASNHKFGGGGNSTTTCNTWSRLIMPRKSIPWNTIVANSCNSSGAWSSNWYLSSMSLVDKELLNHAANCIDEVYFGHGTLANFNSSGFLLYSMSNCKRINYTYHPRLSAVTGFYSLGTPYSTTGALYNTSSSTIMNNAPCGHRAVIMPRQIGYSQNTIFRTGAICGDNTKIVCYQPRYPIYFNQTPFRNGISLVDLRIPYAGWTSRQSVSAYFAFNISHAKSVFIKAPINFAGTSIFQNSFSLKKAQFADATTSGSSTAQNLFYFNSLNEIPSFLLTSSNLPNYCLAQTKTYIDDIAFDATSIGTYCFYASGFKSITMNNSLNNGIPTYAFSNIFTCDKIIFKGHVGSIATYAFANNYSLRLISFAHCTSVPSLANANAFGSSGTSMLTCKIVVPDDLYDSWITTTNWSSTTNNIVSSIMKKSDYEAAYGVTL